MYDKPEPGYYLKVSGCKTRWFPDYESMVKVRDKAINKNQEYDTWHVLQLAQGPIIRRTTHDQP